MHHRHEGQIFSIPNKMYSSFILALNYRSKNRTTCSLVSGDQKLYLCDHNKNDKKQSYLFIKKYETVPLDVMIMLLNICVYFGKLEWWLSVGWFWNAFLI